MTSPSPSRLDPRTRFGTPEALAAREDLPTWQKLRLLRQWERDELQLAVATSEGMDGSSGDLLRRVRLAHAQLRIEHHCHD